MTKTNFDYSIPIRTIQSDLSNFDIVNLSLNELKGIAYGKLYVFFDASTYIVLETGIIDYSLQFDGVIKEIDSGNNNPFSVSCDWYSNSLNYQYDKNDSLTIYEVNSGDFEITTKYSLFKKGFLKFKKRILEELVYYYPDLEKNQSFINI